jgi:hypothetical protein
MTESRRERALEADVHERLLGADGALGERLALAGDWGADDGDTLLVLRT